MNLYFISEVLCDYPIWIMRAESLGTEKKIPKNGLEMEIILSPIEPVSK